MGSRLRRACGSRRDCGGSSRTFVFFFLSLFCVSRANNVSITFSHVHLISERADRRQSNHVIVIVIYKDYWIIYAFFTVSKYDRRCKQQ